MNQPKVRSTTHLRGRTLKPAPGSRRTTSTSMPSSAPCSTTFWLYPPSTHALVTVGATAATRVSTCRPTGESARLAAETPSTISRPRVSTAMCRLRPRVFLFPSNPTVSGAALPEALTVWESTATAVGSSLRPRARRSLRRSRSWIRSVVPSSRHAAKYPYTVLNGGKSCGRYSQAHPVRLTYRIAFTISRNSCTGWLPLLTLRSRRGVRQADSSGSITAHSPSDRSLRYGLRPLIAPVQRTAGSEKPDRQRNQPNVRQARQEPPQDAH